MSKQKIKSLVTTTAKLLTQEEVPSEDEFVPDMQRLSEVLGQMKRTCKSLACDLNIDEEKGGGKKVCLSRVRVGVSVVRHFYADVAE
jgi:hypothetical protein